MITPLGDISEYGVFRWRTTEDGKWPEAILSLEPLFKLYQTWSTELQELENRNDLDSQTKEQNKAQMATLREPSD
jgi:hypothetical protein